VSRQVRTAARIPPMSERPEFARYNRTGRIHILCYRPRYGEPGGPEVDPSRPFTAEHLMSALREPAEMLCGKVFRVSGFDEFPGTWASGDEFDDDDLCIRCVQALGDQQWRAFHVDNRGPS
jgi:hypothetical protein